MSHFVYNIILVKERLIEGYNVDSIHLNNTQLVNNYI